MTPVNRVGIFVHDPDGDMGFGQIVGPFRSWDAANRKADAIERAAQRDNRTIECIVLPLGPGSESATSVATTVGGQPS